MPLSKVALNYVVIGDDKEAIIDQIRYHDGSKEVTFRLSDGRDVTIAPCAKPGLRNVRTASFNGIGRYPAFPEHCASRLLSHEESFTITALHENLVVLCTIQ